MNIEDEIREYIVNELLFDQPHVHLSSKDSILEKKIIDSMALVQLIEFLEQEYGIEIVEEELKLENFRTISDISDFVLSKQNPVA
jgi:acyl carrier protein